MTYREFKLKEYLDKIDKYANGIIQDKNEMDKVALQAQDIKHLVIRLKMELDILDK